MAAGESPITAACMDYVGRNQLPLYLQDVASLVSANPWLDLQHFLPEYFKAVVSGQHVVGRHYAFASGSYHNRCHLLVAVTRSLGHLPPLGLSLGDYHGLLQLLVPDLPLAAVKNAWSTAVALQEGSTPPPQAAAATSAQPQQQQAQQAQHEARVTPSVFLRVFCTTFLFEHFLLLVRRTAFDAEKHCLGLEALQDAILAARQQVGLQGWRAPEPVALNKVLGQLEVMGRSSGAPVLFGDFVRAVCLSTTVKQDVQQQLEAAAAAAAALGAEDVAGSRGQQLGGSSSEDDEWDDPDSPHGQQRRHSTLHVPGQTGGGSGQQGRVSGTGRPLSATRSSSIGAGSRPSSGGVAPRAGGGSSAGGTPWK